MPVYRKGKTSWRVRIWKDGQRRDWVVHGSKADAEAFEAKTRLEIAQGARLELRVVPTFSDFCASQYKPHAQMHLKDSTWRNRTYQLATLMEHLGDLRLHEIGTAEIDRYKRARQATGVGPSTINDDIKALFVVLNYARELGYALPPPRAKRLRTHGRRNAEAWTAKEVKKLLDSCRQHAPEILPIVVFLLNTGCRKGESLALEWKAVDLERRVVRIWPSEEWQPKNNEAREVPISDALFLWLCGPRRSERWVFPAHKRYGKREEVARYAYWPQRLFDLARSKAGLTGGPHKARHTYAAHFLAACPDMYLLGKILGHSTTRVTELYGHLLPESLVRARGAVSFGAEKPVKTAGSKRDTNTRRELNESSKPKAALLEQG